MPAKRPHFTPIPALIRGKPALALTIIALLMAAILWPAAANAQAMPPHRFGGTASLDSEPVSQGTQVAAIIGGVTVATATANDTGSYIITVPATYAGQTITFTIGGYTVAETVAAVSGRVQILNLNAVTLVSTATPAPTPTPAPTATPGPTPTPAPTSTPGPANESTPAPEPAPTPAPTAPAPTPDATPVPTPTPGPTPEPTATPEPTPTHTPSPANNSFRVGPTVNLRPVNDLIDQDKDGLVEAVFRNPALNDKPMVVEMSVQIPSGFHIYGEGLASDVAAGVASASFTVQPGQSRNIHLNVKSEKVGTFTIHFGGLYWPENNKDNFKPISLTHPFTVRAPSRWPFLPPGAPAATAAPQAGAAPGATAVPAAPVATAAPPAPAPTAAPAGDGAPSASCSLSPDGSSANGAGDLALLALPLVGLAGLVLARRRKTGDQESGPDA